MERPVLLTDVDDVCLSWAEGFKMYASRVLNKQITGLPANWEMIEWLGVENLDEVNKIIEDFNHGAWEFGCLPSIAKAHPNLKEIHKNGIDIVAITCCSTDHTTKSLRHANLYHVFGPIFKQIICLPLKHSKMGELRKFQDSNVLGWIEDKPESAMDGFILGYDTYLVRCSHNRDYEKNNPDHFNYVHSWDEITPRLLEKI